MDPATLTLLKVGFLLLLYLFLLTAVMAVYREVSPRRVAADRVSTPPRRTVAASPPAAPKPPAPARELAIVSPAEAQQSFPLDGEITIGRGPAATVRLEDTFVSTAHARLSRRGDGWVVEDLGSTNGTTLNGRVVAGEVPVGRGDRIQVGETVLEFRG